MVVFSSFFLALTLFMARVCADHAHHAFATNDATVLADAANGTTYFHWLTLLFMVEQRISISKRPFADKGEIIKIIVCELWTKKCVYRRFPTRKITLRNEVRPTSIVKLRHGTD
jgi:hypothetical protein